MVLAAPGWFSSLLARAQTEVDAQSIAAHVGQTDDDRHGDAKLPSVELLVTVRELGDAADTVCRQSQVDTGGICTVAVEKSTTREKYDGADF